MKRFAILLLAAAMLLGGCGPTRTEPLMQEEAAQGVPVAYVPLDDRPDNEERVVYLAQSLGYDLHMPQKDDYRTRLDGQPCNENGTQSGDRGDLYQWVMEQEEAGCDRYILSLDQLLSGGLVNSRAMSAHEDVVIRDPETGEETALSEFQVLERLLSALTEDPGNRVWLLDSVMRLAPTVGYQDGTLEDYNALRAYGAQPRPELTGKALNLQAIEENYTNGADGLPLSLADYGLEESQAAEYLAARSRKMELSSAMMELVEGAETDRVRVLIGIDDSSEENSIQKNEIAYLRSLLREGDALLSGVDDLAFKAVAGLYLEETGWTGAAASVQYFGGTEDQPACAYDSQSLETIVAEHFAFFHLTQVPSGEEALSLLVLTQPAEEGRQKDYCDALISAYNANRKAGIPTIVIDAGNGTYGTAFHQALTDRAELGWALSYAGFLDMAIVTGTALSHGVARYAFLQNGQQTKTTERAFARTVADSILKDFCYKHVVRQEILSYVQGELGGNPDNFWQPDIDREAILSRLEAGMEAATAPVIENLERSNFISSLAPYGEQGWGGVELGDYRFPWDRAFEIGMEIYLGEFTQPHQKILGLYYQ